MAKRVAVYCFAAITGIALGLASAIYMAGLWPGTKPLDFGDVEVDGWRSDFAIGSEAANPYTRARVARHGLLALAKTEAVYFTRDTDDRGEPLREDCTYRLSVGKMPADWWSVTLYDADSMLPMNDDEALSVNLGQDNVARIGDETVGYGLSAVVSPERPDGRDLWISSRGAPTFDLMLRLYVPSEDLLERPEAVLTPPTIERMSCDGEAA